MENEKMSKEEYKKELLWIEYEDFLDKYKGIVPTYWDEKSNLDLLNNNNRLLQFNAFLLHQILKNLGEENVKK